MVEQAAGMLRRFLDANGLKKWTCFFTKDVELGDVEKYLVQLKEDDLRWVSLGSLSRDGHQPSFMEYDPPDTPASWRHAGILRLRRYKVIISRWFYYVPDQWKMCTLCAAASVDEFQRLCADIQKLRRIENERFWHIWSDMPTSHSPVPRVSVLAWEDLVLEPPLRKRLQTEVVGFFSDAAAALYRELNIPYRRGVLLHGPPGNGKTSILRALGALQPNITAMMVRPSQAFNDDDFIKLFRDWTRQSPAMLVIEDLGSILSAMTLSTFLNQIDGIDQFTGGGLLLLASTNHPENLNPAINNRPGRFDVVVEVGPPNHALRARYFKHCALQPMGAALMEELAEMTADLSFAQLREIVTLSGLIALRAARRSRAPDDVREAVKVVLLSNKEANRGFPGQKTRAGFNAERVDI
jgi:energy-coupling factor transporter ATP-binding protein EcfA2